MQLNLVNTLPQHSNANNETDPDKKNIAENDKSHTKNKNLSTSK